ncbi:MAG TPA: SUMF1/EgtB/PvdO family nonheme iron enzyme [Rhodanobacteraceae bacterium]|nr:SUMF1/EgtB/PvdO family nonheme iron enzyme [Rhodanobacteraceae bacterium]
MPGTENIRSQHAFGGTIGIVLLGFALTYRFFPGVLELHPQAQQQAATTQANRRTAAPWAAERTQPAATSSTGKVTGTSLAQAIAMGPPLPTSKATAALLKKARLAEQRDKSIRPDRSKAIALYRQALQQDPDNAEALNGLRRIGGAVRDWAVAALERGDEEEAQRYATLFAELPHSEEELAGLHARLKTLHQVLPLLTHAADLMRTGHALTPAGDNALAVYRKVLALDQGNRLADAGLASIERSYLDRALAAAAQDDFSGADAILAEASAIRPGSHDLLDTRARVEGIRRQRAETVLSQARSALDSGNADLAERLGKRAQSISPDLVGLDEFNQRLHNARLYASLSPGQVIRDRLLDLSGAAPPVVVIPTGSFVMGSPADEPGHADNEEPQRQVRITAGFALGQTEVTVGQFRDFVRASNYRTDAGRLGTGSVYDEKTGRMSDRHGVTWQDDYHGQHAADDLPVINVSWNDAQAYLGWLTRHTGKTYRLPSEAEFEYALRARSTARYPWGEGNPAKPVGNFTGEGDRSPSKRSWSRAFARYSDGYWGPAPVKSFVPNTFGLYDMDGNVSEWVRDCWHDNYVRAPRTSAAWINPGCQAHVIRGGSWGSDPAQVRSAFRIAAPSNTRSARVGFRIARDL